MTFNVPPPLMILLTPLQERLDLTSFVLDKAVLAVTCCVTTA